MKTCNTVKYAVQISACGYREAKCPERVVLRVAGHVDRHARVIQFVKAIVEQRGGGGRIELGFRVLHGVRFNAVAAQYGVAIFAALM